MSGQWKGSNRRAELPPNWDELRRAAFERDGYRCVWPLPSGARCPNPATDCDHIGSKRNHALWNLRSLCAPHHNKRTAIQGNAAKSRYGWSRATEPHPFDTL